MIKPSNPVVFSFNGYEAYTTGGFVRPFKWLNDFAFFNLEFTRYIETIWVLFPDA